jgi:peptide/nickel transport system substrate-binding protein
VLLKYEVEDGRRFTFHLRPGHRWSDGSPLTAEDFRFASKM